MFLISIYVLYDVKRVSKKNSEVLQYFVGMILLWILVVPIWFFYDRKKCGGENIKLNFFEIFFITISYGVILFFIISYFLFNPLGNLNKPLELCEDNSECLSGLCTPIQGVNKCSIGFAPYSACIEDSDCIEHNCQGNRCQVFGYGR